MKTITRSYPIVCPSCNGLGQIDDPLPVTSTPKILCPACNGFRTVTVTETVFESSFDMGTQNSTEQKDGYQLTFRKVW